MSCTRKDSYSGSIQFFIEPHLASGTLFYIPMQFFPYILKLFEKIHIIWKWVYMHDQGRIHTHWKTETTFILLQDEGMHIIG